MANVNAAFGLRPIRYYSSGRPYTGGATEFFATGATGAIYIGDPVVAAGAANTTEIQGRAAGTLATCTVALDGDGDVLLGVCVGVVPVDRASLIYRADSTDRIILVVTDPDLVYIGQTDAASTAWAGTDVFSYANMLVGTGSTITGRSGWTLDTTDGPDNNDPSNQLLIMGLAKYPNNAIGANSVWEVMINDHQLANVADAGRFTGV